MKYRVKKPFLLRTNPDIPGIGEIVNENDIIDITVKRALAVRDLEGEWFVERLTEDQEPETEEPVQEGVEE